MTRLTTIPRILAASLGLMLALHVPSRAGGMMDDLAYGRSKDWWFLQVAIGTCGSVTPMGIEGFPATGFDGGPAHALTVRWARVRKGEDTNLGFALQIMADRCEMRLREQGEALGTLRSRSIILTPGLQIWSNDYLGAGAFVGLLGLGCRSSDFREGPVIRRLETETGADVNIDVAGAWFGALLPVQVDLPVWRGVTVGAAFPGILFGNAGTTWRVNGTAVPEITTMFLSHWQVLGSIGVVF